MTKAENNSSETPYCLHLLGASSPGRFLSFLAVYYKFA
jgi:hypothetical protein